MKALGLYTHTHTHTHTSNLKEKIKITLIIVTILLIILLCFNVGAYAAYVLSATDVSYTKSNGTTVNVKQALDELYTTYPLAKAVSVGDYVAYDAGNNHSYTSPKGTGLSHGNGDSSQKFISSSSIKWRVLRWDDETGGVVLISEGPIGKLTLQGAIGYLYVEQELNEICKIYGYGTGANTNKKFNYITGDTIEGTTAGTITGSGARSLNVDDVNEICGVIPSTALNSNYGKAPYTKNIYYPTTKQKTGCSTSAASRTELYTYYTYIATNYLENTKEVYKMLFRNTTNEENIKYWLASRCLYSGYDISYIYVRKVDGGVGNIGLADDSSSHVYEVSRDNSIRPIVFLKSTLQTNGKNSNGAWNIIDK